ncbi:phosphate ABC transporter substrate-binding protein [Flavihumibacter sp. R14]|nr:phosphate ABC transporter substrate-binding protein [Flavihumibacter soli]
MKHRFKFFSFIGVALIVSACQNQQAAPTETTYTSGETSVIIDESFAPIIEDQSYVFEKHYPKSKLNRIYKPENEVLNLFLNDSVRVAVLSRELTADEAKRYQNKNIKLRVNRFAIDGIALITNRSNPDSLITVAEIISLMKGEPGKIKSLVFDNPNSSTVRYMKDLAGIKELPAKGIYALKSNPEVIKYVNANPGSIGVIGINWVMQPDEDLEEIVGRLKIMGVKNLPGKPGSDAFYKPNQNDLALEMYPLTRNLYIINGEGKPGLGTGFASFIAGELGQRIVLKSGLLPDSIPSRQVIIKNKINN